MPNPVILNVNLGGSPFTFYDFVGTRSPANFQRSVEDNFGGRSWILSVAILRKSAEYVLYVDDGVVHDGPQRNRQTADCHGVK